MHSINPTKPLWLEYNEGSSDKVYQVLLQPDTKNKERWFVNYAYGRRGAVLTTGSKTITSVDYDTALQVHGKLVKEKLAKGYKPTTADSTTTDLYVHVDKTVSGENVQLLNPIILEDAKLLIEDDNWLAQEKFDGHRKMAKKHATEITGINRKGLVVALPNTILSDLKDRCKYLNLLLDGEQIGQDLYVFDEASNKELTCVKRLEILTRVCEVSDFKYIHLVETAYTTQSKRTLFNSLEKGGREGIVFKRKDSKYIPGRPNSKGSQLKYKFYETASFIVASVNLQRSVEVKLIDAKKGHKHVLVGNVTIPINHTVPVVGTVIEVRYLYAFPEGSIYQPIYLGRRSDIDASECLVSQLKYKTDV